MKTEIGTIDYQELYDMEAESHSKDRMIALWDDREKQEEMEMIEEELASAIARDDVSFYQWTLKNHPEFLSDYIPARDGVDEF